LEEGRFFQDLWALLKMDESTQTGFEEETGGSRRPTRPHEERGLRSAGFLGLVVTQFLGALNDNMFRWLVVPIAQITMGDAEALALGLACFTIPYLLLAPLAGHLADSQRKRSVIVWCKVAEIVLMLAGLIVLATGQTPAMFLVVALMGAQSALFAPAKFGSLPEILPSNKLSAGNGVMGLATVSASALGTIAGFMLFALALPAGTLSAVTEARQSGQSLVLNGSTLVLWPSAVALLGVALAGWLTSLLIPRQPAADPGRKLSWNPVTESWRSMRLLSADIPLLRASLGIAFFWLLASLSQLNIDPFGDRILGLSKAEIGPLLAVLVVGLGLGSVLAGIWSGGKVELGIVPLGAVGIVACSLLLYVTGHVGGTSSENSNLYFWSCVWLFGLGTAAGLFNIPLEAYLQHRSPPQQRGTILAAANFLTFAFILAASGIFLVLSKSLGLSADEVFLVCGLATIPVLIYIVWLLPDSTIRFAVWLLSKTVYRIRIYGRENLPERGGALLVANHVSWIDGILLLLASSRPIRMLAYSEYANSRMLRGLSKIFRVIPINANDGPKSLLQSLQTAREAAQAGELVCIFAEGSITRTGQLQPFQRGLLRIVKGTDVPVVPVWLNGLWGSIFSFHGGRFFWKRPRQWPYPVSISFGTPLANPDDINRVRLAVQTLGAESVEHRKSEAMIPVRRFLRQCKRSRSRLKVADSSGASLTGAKLLAGSIIFRRLLAREVLGPDEKNVGVLLPPSVGGAVVNASLALLGKVAVNLNYTLSNEDVNYCIREAGITHVLTSRKFLERKPMTLNTNVVFLEDVKEKVSKLDKLVGALHGFLTPAFILERLYGLKKIDPEDLLTIIFTSGSTGEPKGVMLSHLNVMTNIEGVDASFRFTSKDALMGILPFFHSFGFTATLWLGFTLDPMCVYHFNPLDARMIGKLIHEYKCTILMATPTFLRTFLKRIDKEQFASIDLVVTGAEKLPQELAQQFHDKYGFYPTEGYGTTELSPVAAVNIPRSRNSSQTQSGEKLGTVGRPFPLVVAKVVDPDSGADLGLNTEGLLLIKGPNVMKGYLNHPEKTAGVIRDGWYNTGDFARIDDEGFIQITGRQSRFSKIGGEMVPHVRIEELLTEIVLRDQPPTEDEEAKIPLVVSAVPDEAKGERLVVLHIPLHVSVEAICADLAKAGVPNLWIPGRDSFYQIDSVPILGTGKLDLKAVKLRALECACPLQKA